MEDFHPPKCRGKVQKMGVITPIPKLLHNTKKLNKKKVARKKSSRGIAHCLHIAGHDWLETSGCPPLLHELAAAHAYPTHTSPQIFKHS